MCLEAIYAKTEPFLGEIAHSHLILHFIPCFEFHLSWMLSKYQILKSIIRRSIYDFVVDEEGEGWISSHVCLLLTSTTCLVILFILANNAIAEGFNV